jgi:hypothetical protein
VNLLTLGELLKEFNTGVTVSEAALVVSAENRLKVRRTQSQEYLLRSVHQVLSLCRR